MLFDFSVLSRAEFSSFCFLLFAFCFLYFLSSSTRSLIHVFLFQSAAKIGNSQGKGEIDFIMMRSASMPGPHDYYEGLPPQTRTPLRALAREVGLG